MKLSRVQQNVLRALVKGATLKSHRHLDGTKVYKLHPLAEPTETISRKTIEALRARTLIHSNQKFPAATYLLTEKGKEAALGLDESSHLPLSASNFLSE
ncbi:MAG TPA: hypothetical protein VGD99_25100 [Anaerolineae bacterium]